jgi:ectoine hydroxylase-related dioxygenase (phytanoyl-CoA dioxygenase family)
MNKQELVNLFTQNGFDVFSKIIDVKLIEKINKKTDLLVPHRGHAMDHKYYPADKIAECKDLAVWWSQELSGWPEVQQITRQLIDVIGVMFDDPAAYIADIITNEPGNTHIKPHIDSPYRFPKWWDEDELLGVQCILPLCEFTKENGGTGVLPNSHNTRWVVKDSYAGKYNEEFLAGVEQPKMSPGDALIYHPRTLHSTMPNNTDVPRRALLIHITSKEMARLLQQEDTIWQEESKKMSSVSTNS